MADSSKRLIRRKHSSVDLQQRVVFLDVYKRPLSSCSLSGMPISHEAGIATTENEQLYLIEKGNFVSTSIINNLIRYKEGASRIVLVTRKDIRDWQLVKSVEQVNPGVTLEDLFDACGSDYSFLTDNCWNSTQRMRVAANQDEDGLAWQEKAALIGAGVAAAVGIGALLFGALSGGDSKEKEKKEEDKARKY